MVSTPQSFNCASNPPDENRATPMTLGLSIGLSVVVVLLASAWMVADPAAELRGALAEVSLAAAVLTVVFALRETVRDRPAPRPEHALL